MGMHEEIDARKGAVRQELRARRASLTQEERDEADLLIMAGVLGSTEYARTDLLLSYLSFEDEVATRRIVRHALDLGKEVALPRCEGSQVIRWYLVEDLDGLVRSSLGIEEPDPAICTELSSRDLERALALVPGLAFDRQGQRIGYGGGFYDRFLAGFRGRSMGLCRESSLFEDLCELGIIDEHDVAVDIVMTDAHEYRH